MTSLSETAAPSQPIDILSRANVILPLSTPLIARLWYQTTYETNRCHVWHGSRNRDGYGIIMVNARHEHTHRAAYKLLVGPIPEGLHLDHLCRNRACWNPDHLEPVTSRENTMRSNQALASANAKKTHCKRGHELSGPNLLIRRGERPGSVKRGCLTCKRLTDRTHTPGVDRRKDQR